jgi:hypothetical protein
MVNAEYDRFGEKCWIIDGCYSTTEEIYNKYNSTCKHCIMYPNDMEIAKKQQKCLELVNDMK